MLVREVILIIRNLKRNLIVSAINIVGLAIGFTIVILSARYVYTENTFDKFHTNYKNIYRIERVTPQFYANYCPNIMYSWLKDNVPEINKLESLMMQVLLLNKTLSLEMNPLRSIIL